MSSQRFLVAEHTFPAQHIREYPRATANEQEVELQLAVKCYTPLNNPDPQAGDVTIIGGHANGYPKELYEPLWDELLVRSETWPVKIRAIWIMDVAHQGRSAVLNENELGNDPSWYDGARDMLQMVNVFRKDMLRPIVGIGHSMGGNQLTNLSLMHPRLLTTLILLEPVILDMHKAPWLGIPHPPTKASTFRKDLWPSLQEAETSFRRKKYYQQWDPRVLDLWLKYGLRELPTAIYPRVDSGTGGTTPVTLTTTKHQEVFTFQRPNFSNFNSEANPGQVNKLTHPDLDNIDVGFPVYRPEMSVTFARLPFIRPSVLYLFGGKSELAEEEHRRTILETTGAGLGGSGGSKLGRVKEMVFPEYGHLVPLETVKLCADASADWLENELRRWKEEEIVRNQDWTGQDTIKKTTMSDDWKYLMTDEGWKKALRRGGHASKL